MRNVAKDELLSLFLVIVHVAGKVEPADICLASLELVLVKHPLER